MVEHARRCMVFGDDFLRLSVQRLLGGGWGVTTELCAVCHQDDCHGGHGDLESGKESGSVLGGGVERVVQVRRIADEQERRGLRPKPAGTEREDGRAAVRSAGPAVQSVRILHLNAFGLIQFHYWLIVLAIYEANQNSLVPAFEK